MFVYDRDPPGMEYEYTTSFDIYIASLIREKYKEASEVIEKYFSLSERESTPFINRLCMSLRKDQDWAYGLCEEMDLNEQHIASLKDDVKQMTYLTRYQD